MVRCYRKLVVLEELFATCVAYKHTESVRLRDKAVYEVRLKAEGLEELKKTSQWCRETWFVKVMVPYTCSSL